MKGSTSSPGFAGFRHIKRTPDWCYHRSIIDGFENIETAERVHQELIEDVQNIQTQLGDRRRTDEHGDRLGIKDYWAWRRRAQQALTKRLAELRAVKAWIREHRQATNDLEDKDAIQHLQQLCAILDELREEDVEFDSEESTQIAAAKDFLRRAGVKHETAAKPSEEKPCPTPTAPPDSFGS